MGQLKGPLHFTDSLLLVFLVYRTAYPPFYLIRNDWPVVNGNVAVHALFVFRN